MNENLNPQSNMHDELDQETLQRLQRLRPNVKPDPKFASMLRQEIGEQANNLSVTLDKTSKQPLTLFSFMNKFIIPLVAVAVVAAGAGYWYSAGNGGALIGFGGNQLLSDKIAVTELDQNSFGELDQVQILASNNADAPGIGGPGSGGDTETDAATADSDKMMAPGTGGGSGDVSILPYPEYPTYTYEYGGEEITDLPSEHGVLQRQKPEQPESLVARIIRFFSFGLIDLTKLQNAKLQNVSFIEDREYGLGVNVDLQMGSVNIYQNWEKWPQPRYECYGYYCGPQPPLTPAEIPSDKEAISIADQFLTEYSISREGYADGEVLEYYNWRILYEQAEDKSTVYLPEQINVVYPLRLGDQLVYDESGNLTGMSVTIDVRSRKVAGLYGLETKQFNRSSYIGETDVKRIMEIALRGGYRNYDYPYIEPGKEVTLKLGTPKISLVRMWYTKDVNKPGEELYVPSLVFPIQNAPQDYWRKNVVVPLVKDILDNENIYGTPSPYPMPIDPVPAVEEPVEEPLPVEPDGGIGETPDAPVSQTEPAVLPEFATELSNS